MYYNNIKNSSNDYDNINYNNDNDNNNISHSNKSDIRKSSPFLEYAVI